jgi:hypothetical protein
MFIYGPFFKLRLLSSGVFSLTQPLLILTVTPPWDSYARNAFQNAVNNPFCVVDARTGGS